MRLTLAQIAAISWGTALEALRSRLLFVSLVFGLILVFVSIAAASVSIAEQARLILDVGLAATSIIGSLIAVALTLTSFANEITRRTAYTLLARPITRSAFVLGKFVGVLLVIELTVLLMGLATILTVWLYGGELPPAFFAALWLTGIEVAVVAAVALVFSTMAVPVLAATYTVAIVLVGNFGTDILSFALRLEGQGKFLGFGLHLLYFLLPNQSKLSLRAQTANYLPVPTEFFVYGTVYGSLYAVVALLLAMWIFSRRQAV